MRPLRHYLPDRVYLITARCFEERFFLAPDTQEVSLIVASTLAVAVEKYGLELFAYVVMSNHVHLVVRAPNGGLPEAMQLFFSQVARRINILRGRRGPVFSDRYHHQTICDEGALHNAIRYVLLNPRRAGVSRTASEWDGLNSFADTCEGRVIVCTRHTRGSAVSWTMHRRARSSDEIRATYEEKGGGIREESFVLACQPATLREGEDGKTIHRKFVMALLSEEADAMQSELLARTAVSPDQRPARSKRSRAPACIASSSLSRAKYMEERRSFITAYRVASARFRRGQDATFPPGCCLPWPRLYSLVSCSDTFWDAHRSRGHDETS